MSSSDTSLISFGMTLLERLQQLGAVGEIDYSAYQQSGGLFDDES